MLYRHLTHHCLTPARLSDSSTQGFTQLLARTDVILQKLKTQKEDGAFDLLTLPGKRDDLSRVQSVADVIRSFSQLIILGTGGSALNGQALTSLAVLQPGTTQLHFADNIDPHSFELLLTSLDIPNTAFLCISKSGKTVETLAQTLVCLQKVKAVVGAEKAGKHFFIISDPVDNPIRRLGDSIGATQLDHEPRIGGRFATFTNVALLPAMVAGLSAEGFRAGAEAVITSHFTTIAGEHPEAAHGAALAISLMHEGYDTTVMMPYIDRLANFASWYRQMWAESLGKNGHGTTPVKAMGTVDQHSQLQLYLDGPRNKMVTFIALDTKGQGPRIEEGVAHDPALSYIAGRTLGDIIAAEQRATEDTLARNGCPVRSFMLNRLDEEVMGALLMHFMLETIITAELLGINAYDQPAVEEGKQLTRQLLEAAI